MYTVLSTVHLHKPILNNIYNKVKRDQCVGIYPEIYQQRQHVMIVIASVCFESSPSKQSPYPKLCTTSLHHSAVCPFHSFEISNPILNITLSWCRKASIVLQTILSYINKLIKNHGAP